MTLHVGFGAADASRTWPHVQKLEDELAVQAAVFTDEHGRRSVIMASDFSLIWPAIALRLRDAVAQAVGAEPEQTGVFCTQNHGAPFVGPDFPGLDALEQAHVQAARQAVAALQPAQAAYVQVQPAPSPAICRRKVFGPFGAFTYWFGYVVRPDGAAGCAHLLEMTMRGLLEGDLVTRKFLPLEEMQWSDPHRPLPPVPPDAIMDGPVDGLIQGLFFRTPGGVPIGSIARWAAHPAAATGLTGVFSGDYPVYLRRRLQERFGGQALFLTGPCGNQCCIIHRKSVECARRIGTEVADHLLRPLPGAPWQRDVQVRAASRTIDLPVREDIPRSLEQAKLEYEQAVALLQRRRNQGAELPELKRLADRVETLGYYDGGAMASWTGVDFEQINRGRISHPIFGLRVGSAAIVGLPGEPFGAHSVRLRQACPSVHLITSEECNGYLCYIPTAEEHPLGGYGVCASLFAPQVEEVFQSEVPALINMLEL